MLCYNSLSLFFVACSNNSDFELIVDPDEIQITRKFEQDKIAFERICVNRLGKNAEAKCNCILSNVTEFLSEDELTLLLKYYNSDDFTRNNRGDLLDKELFTFNKGLVDNCTKNTKFKFEPPKTKQDN